MLCKRARYLVANEGNSIVSERRPAIADNATIADKVLIEDDSVIIREGARIDMGAIIGRGVEIGQSAWVRAGAVVLRSVPSYAIVEGNPAQVVGYVATSDRAARGEARLIDPQDYRDRDRPTQIDLGVGGAKLFLMRNIRDPRGALTVGEWPSELPFAPARYFAVYNVPSAELRGEHAHKKCEQFLICAHGSARILLDDGEQRCEVTLDRPDIGVHMPAMIWGTQYRYSPDAVLLVFASRAYEAEDYLRSYDEFLAEKARA